MRWLFLLLLALNIGYLGWELYWPVAPTVVTSRAQHTKVPTIVLLSETRAAAQTPPAVKPVVAEAAAEKPVQTTAPVSIPAPSVATVPAAEAPEAVPDAAPEPAPARNLAHEPDACYTLGPFRELDKLRKVTRDIRDFVVDASFRSHDEREQSMYWVYLSSQPSRAAATALGKRLERKKIRDYYVINSGAQKNGVSLGHFKEKQRAQDLQARVRKAGFDPVMEPVFKTYTIYWLDYRVQADKNIPENALDLRAMPNVSRIDRDCG